MPSALDFSDIPASIGGLTAAAQGYMMSGGIATAAFSGQPYEKGPERRGDLTFSRPNGLSAVLLVSWWLPILLARRCETL